MRAWSVSGIVAQLIVPPIARPIASSATATIGTTCRLSVAILQVSHPNEPQIPTTSRPIPIHVRDRRRDVRRPCIVEFVSLGAVSTISGRVLSGVVVVAGSGVDGGSTPLHRL